MNVNLSATAALLSDPGRAAILLALLDGIALPAGQLATVANVAPQTASSHLSRLVTGRLLVVEQQGRHRYYRLAGADVASAVEALLALTPRDSKNVRISPGSRESLPEELTCARSCYSHLAGRLAVEIADALLSQGFLEVEEPKLYKVTAGGRAWFEQLGINMQNAQMRQPRFARRCLDWTERRHHVAGDLGSVMFRRLKDLKWIVPVRGSRAVRITLEGERSFWEVLKIRAKRR